MAEKFISLWKIVREFLIAGGCIFAIGAFWKSAEFVQTMNDFVAYQKEAHIKIDCTLKTIESDVGVLRDWKVASTQKQFREPFSNNR